MITTDLSSLIADKVLSNKRSFLFTILSAKVPSHSTTLNNSREPRMYMILVASCFRPAGLVDARCSASEVTSKNLSFQVSRASNDDGGHPVDC